MILVVSMPVAVGRSFLTFIAITTSSSAVFPARSPRPLIVHSICRAPASRPPERWPSPCPDRCGSGWRKSPCPPRARLSSMAIRRSTFARRGVAHGVGNVDRGRPGLDGNLDNAAKVIMFGPRRIHRRPLHVVAQVAGMGHGIVDAFGHLVHVQIGNGAVQRRRADKGVNPRAFRVFHRLPAAVDILVIGAGQPADRRIARRRLAMSLTAAKSPSEAIGKPASMISTPISSSRPAISSFSSWVMVAPGDCSPSRRVVSKMRTVSLFYVDAPHPGSLNLFQGSPTASCGAGFCRPARSGSSIPCWRHLLKFGRPLAFLSFRSSRHRRRFECRPGEGTCFMAARGLGR